MSLSFQIENALEQTDGVLALSDPQNAAEAQAWGALADDAETLNALWLNPPSIAGVWSLIPAIGVANIACPGGNCLELIDSEPSLYKEQCITGILSTTNPCSDYLLTVQALLDQMSAKLLALGEPAAAEVVKTTADGVENLTDTGKNVTRPDLKDIWGDAPDWLKMGGAALLALLLIKAIK